MTAGFRFSVVLPTFQRRGLILDAVRSLGRQDFEGTFEVVVVVDGSRDGTAEALRGLDLPIPLTVLEQPNQGAAAARNRGAAAARGEILLFLDDDMEAHPRLLAEHDRSHREGADAVLGHIPLHPDSPKGFLAAAVGRWAEERLRVLSAPDAKPALHDLLTGQLSLRRDLFDRLGGFDEAFTAGGTYGDEDLDFGHRLLAGGWRVVFNPEAVSWQRYVVTPRQHLRQWRQTGRADVTFARKHPERTADLFAHQQRRLPRLWRPVMEAPGVGAVLSALARLPILLLGATGKRPTLAFRLFRWLRGIEYWRGVREAGGIPRPRPLRILAWHAVADLDGDRVIGEYSVPPAVFRKQLEDLERAGYRFVSPDEALRCLEGNGGLPRQPVLLTFDDGYADLEETVRPVLEKVRAPAVAFAVSRRLGGSNDWDQALGARALPLLDASGLKRLGIEIGAHSRTHRRLIKLPEEEMREEVVGSRADLEAAGLPAPRLFAYPYGERNAAALAAAREAGYAAAFTVDPGLARPGEDRFQVPRIEVMRRDQGRRFLRKVARAGRS